MPQVAAPDAAAAPAAGSPTPCHARLALTGLSFKPARQPQAQDACRIDDPVQIDALALPGGAIAFPDRPLVSCAFAESFAGFTRDALAPLAAGHLGRRVMAIGTGPGFACRGRNQVAGARISAHGRGLAIDISWIDLDGRRETVAAPSDPAVARFLGAVRRGACGWFTTILGPGSDAAHADHLHLDRAPRGRDGESRLCQ
jgi:hypothetical protein